MFDIGWTEMLVISVIALLVVGPKDLPAMLRTIGQYVGKAKRMASEFRSQFDDAVRDSDLDEVRKSFEDLKSANPTGEIGKALSPLTEAADDLRNTVENSDSKTNNPPDQTVAGKSVAGSGNSISASDKGKTASATPSSKKSAKAKKSAGTLKAKVKAKKAAPKKAATKKAAPVKKAAVANG